MSYYGTHCNPLFHLENNVFTPTDGHKGKAKLDGLGQQVKSTLAIAFFRVSRRSRETECSTPPFSQAHL